MKRFALGSAILPALLLSGCASAPTPSIQELDAADYGPPPANFKLNVLSFMQAHLRDPESARYTFYQVPQKTYAGTPRKYGWAACVTVNAKNAYGGYTGGKPYFFMVRNNVIIHALYGDGDGNLDPSNVHESCQRIASSRRPTE
jgi:hypothetical protein